MDLKDWNKASKTERWSVPSGDLHNLIDLALDQLDARDEEIARLKGLSQQTIQGARELARNDADFRSTAHVAHISGELDDARADAERYRIAADNLAKDCQRYGAELDQARAALSLATKALEEIAKSGDGIKPDWIDWVAIGRWAKKDANHALSQPAIAKEALRIRALEQVAEAAQAVIGADKIGGHCPDEQCCELCDLRDALAALESVSKENT